MDAPADRSAPGSPGGDTALPAARDTGRRMDPAPSVRCRSPHRHVHRSEQIHQAFSWGRSRPRAPADGRSPARARHAAPRCRRQPVSRRRRAAERTRPPAHASGTYLDLPGLCVPLGQDLDDLTLRAVSKLIHPARPHADHCFQHSGRRAPDTLPSVPDHRPGLRSRPPDSHVPTTATAARHTVVDGSSRRLP